VDGGTKFASYLTVNIKQLISLLVPLFAFSAAALAAAAVLVAAVIN
jgi:hypothetical protein